MLRAQWIVQQQEYRSKYINALGVLRSKGIELSDRRKIKVLYIASAISIIYAEDVPSLDSLADALRFTAIHNEDDVQKVEEAIMEAKLSAITEYVKMLMAITAELSNTMQNIMQMGEKATLADIKALKKVTHKAIEILKQVPDNPRISRYKSELQNIINQSANLIKQYE
jgi:MoxR-like ATPase